MSGRRAGDSQATASAKASVGLPRRRRIENGERCEPGSHSSPSTIAISMRSALAGETRYDSPNSNAPATAIHRRPQASRALSQPNSFFTLTRRDADIALRPAAAAPENPVGRRIATLASTLYASPGYLARCHARTRLDDQDWIGLDDSLEHLASARWMRLNVPPERIVGRANSLIALRAAARVDMGVAPLPCCLADPDQALSRVCAPLTEMDSALWLLVHPDLRKVARVRAVLDFLAARLGEQRPLIEGRAGVEH